MSSSRSVRWAGLRRLSAGPEKAGAGAACCGAPPRGAAGALGAAPAAALAVVAALVAGPAGELGDAADDELLVEDADEPGELDGDLALHAARLDLGDDGGGLVEGGGAAGRGLQVVAADDLAQRELEERGARLDEVAYGVVALDEAQVAGVHAVGAMAM